MNSIRNRSSLPKLHDGLPLPLGDRLFDEQQAAACLGVSVSYLRKSRSEGAHHQRTPAPPFVRVEGRIYYRHSALVVWLSGLRGFATLAEESSCRAVADDE